MTDRPKIRPEVLARLRDAVERSIEHIASRRASGAIVVPPAPDCGLLRHLRGDAPEQTVIGRTTFAEAVERAKAAEKMKRH